MENTSGGFNSGADSHSLALAVMVPMAPGDAGLAYNPLMFFFSIQQ